MLCSVLRTLMSCLEKSGSKPEPKPGGPTTRPIPSNKIRVAVLGGGPAGVSAAFRLSDPKLDGIYDVTLYQMGWRLGGKCASGRDMAVHKRIKEHGLHMLMGCYHYAFFAIKECFAEWQPRPGCPWTSIEDAFSPVDTITLMEQDSSTTLSGWATWQHSFPPSRASGKLGKAAPGEPQRPEILSIRDLLNPFTVEVFGFIGTKVFATKDDEVHVLGKFGISLEKTLGEILAALQSDDAASYKRVVEHLTELDTAIRMNYGGSGADALWCPIDGSLSQENRRIFIRANLGMCVLIGAVSDVLLQGGGSEDSLNSLEFRSWLRSKGACDISLDSAPIRVLYDLMFAYAGGNSLRSSPSASRLENGNVAAGVALRFVLESVIGYREAPLWKMNAGMGDTIFMPFYQVLKARGVDIKLFHRVTKIRLTPDKQRVGSIELAQQAEFVNQDYSPFEVVRGLDCWPDQPRWQELKNGSKLRKAKVAFELAADNTMVKSVGLNLNEHFDVVLLALPPEVIKLVAADLQTANFRWARALRASRSVITAASQFWLKDPVETLGGTTGAIVSAFEPDFSSWAEMSHLVGREDWPTAPKGLAYTCGVAPEATRDAAQKVDEWIRTHLWKLWPLVGKGNVFDPSLLVARYDRTNDDPSELYVQTPAGTVDSRLMPDQPYFENLLVAGDWTRTRFSGGCLESAFESGFRAADAIREFFPSIGALASSPEDDVSS